jgi:hypothetical protein
MTQLATVSVVAGGWSFLEADPQRVPGYVIAVNDAALNLPRVDAIVSMDRRWTEYRWAALVTFPKPAHLRWSALQNLAHAEQAWVEGFNCDHRAPGLNGDPGRLDGRSSGMCALSLVLRLRPKRVVLFGFDHGPAPDGRLYWYPPYPWARPHGSGAGNYAEWRQLHHRNLRQLRAAGIEVWDTSPTAGPMRVAPGTVLERTDA